MFIFRDAAREAAGHILQDQVMEQPEGYLPDQNRHNHLSAKTMNSDWVFYYELPMVKALSTLK